MDGRGLEGGKDDGWPTTRLAAGARRVSAPRPRKCRGWLAGGVISFSVFSRSSRPQIKKVRRSGGSVLFFFSSANALHAFRPVVRVLTSLLYTLVLY